MSRRASARDESYKEIELLAREAHQLKQTIAALREALEQAKIEQDAAVTRALGDSNQEMTQVKDAVVALRE
ncbi:MAG: hypothetical protein HYY47_01860, partial [Deltaproteobacteria bacterium]|nr:hypothetical protein [Deltaproteobacteria bacterium]